MVNEMEPLKLIVEALEFAFPAYCANAVPVIAGGGRPIDLGRNFRDGKRVFGKNKTLRGFFSGLVVGTLSGLGESAAFGSASFPIMLGVLLSFGALIGDLAGAFLKRRLDLAPGDPLPIVDQVDFIASAILFSLPVSLPLLSWELVLAALLITLPVHLFTNYAAYKLRLKTNPW
jgi:CDP-2,3-bis-(O-geranylgeranyl)-sn-glycerol synthase